MTDLVADAYASIPTLRTFTRNAGTSDATDPDAAIELLALETASRLIDRACGRLFTATLSVAAARVFTPATIPARDPLVYPSSTFPWTWYRHFELPIDDLFDTSTMSVAFDTTGNGAYNDVVTGYRVGPLNAAAKGKPYTTLLFDSGIYPPLFQNSVQVTAKWGWTSVPTTIQQATLLQASRILKRRDAPFGIAGSPDLGSQMRLLARLDPDVEEMVKAFKKNWGAVD